MFICSTFSFFTLSVLKANLVYKKRIVPWLCNILHRKVCLYKITNIRLYASLIVNRYDRPSHIGKRLYIERKILWSNERTSHVNCTNAFNWPPLSLSTLKSDRLTEVKGIFKISHKFCYFDISFLSKLLNNLHKNKNIMFVLYWAYYLIQRTLVLRNGRAASVFDNDWQILLEISLCSLVRFQKKNV